MKKIAIVAHALSAGGGISVGRNLIGALQHELDNIHYQFFLPEGLGYETIIEPSEQAEIHFYKKQGLFKRLLYDAFFLEKSIQQFKPDLILCLANRGVFYGDCPQFLLCHDSHLFYPSKFYSRETFLKKVVKFLQRQRLATDLKKATYLFVQTEVASQRIRDMYAFTGNAVILPNAVSIDVTNSSHEQSIPDVIHKHIHQFKLFYLTRYYPHKNLELLVDLFDQYRDQMSDCRLFITIDESQHPLAKKLLKDISRKKLDTLIINVGPLSQTELPGYFSNVDALIMPTTLESFSGTYLEAMNFRCPILTSNLDFAKAICADAAIYFDPWSLESAFEALQKLRNNPVVKSNLQENGQQRLHDFGATWSENGERLASIIRKTLNLRRNPATF